MSQIWLSSDWHYGHKNIVEGVSEWTDKSACRNFQTLEEHNEILVQNINKCAQKDDVIIFNGDFSFGGKDNIFEFRQKLNCKNIHLIYGNHDIHIKKNYNNCQNLFLSTQDILYKTFGKDNFVFCHYAMRTWDRAHHGSIMLYGHSHGNLSEYKTTITVSNEQLAISFDTEKYFRTMDIGIDTHKEFRPYHIDEIREIMADRIPLHVDHHNEKTN